MVSTTLKRYLLLSPNRFTHTPIPTRIPTHTSRLLLTATSWLLAAMAVLLSHIPTPTSRIFLSISSRTNSTYKGLPKVFFVPRFLRCRCITSLIRTPMRGAIVLTSVSMKGISTQTLRMDPALGSCVICTRLTTTYTCSFCVTYSGIYGDSGLDIVTVRVANRVGNGMRSNYGLEV